MANLYSYNTSSAYKLNDFEIGRKPVSKELHHDEKKVNQNRMPSSNKRARRSLKPVAVLMTVLCFAVAFIIVNGYVKINEISKLDAEYNKVVAANQDLQVKIDKAVDLEQLQQVAEEKYGMIRPERSQVFYIDMEQEDYAVTNNNKEMKNEEVTMNGVTGTITGTMNIFK